jgi:two-component system, NarL family, response regulator NreC
MNRLQILLADDHKVMREGLRMLINAQPDMEVVGEADHGQGAIALLQKLQPDLIVMDISMPELDGLEATERLQGLHPHIKILTLTRHTDKGYLEQMLKAGASGYVLKQSVSEELVRAIRAVAAGQTYVDPALTDQLVAKVIGKGSSRSSHAESTLSQREEEVLRCIAWGFLNKAIASRLEISVKTVEAHKAHAMQKMGMKNRIDIVRYALLRGWLQNV